MKWMVRNLGWKLGSLSLAVLLWIALSAQPEVVTSQPVSILFRNLAPELLISNESPDNVRIEMRGPEDQLTAGSLSDTAAVFDLSDVDEPGEQTFTVSTINLNLPQGVTFLRAVPSQFRLRFEHLLSKEVPVEIKFSGDLPEGYRLVSKRAIPKVLRIAGAESRLEPVEFVETDPVDLTRMTASTTIRVNAFVPEAQLHFESTPVVAVELNVQQLGK